MSYQRILVPIDFSDDSLNALQAASAEFAGANKTLVLLHVFDPSTEESGSAHIMSRGRMQAVSRIGLEDTDEPVNPTAERLSQLQALAKPLSGAWKEVETVVSLGNPTEKIITTATNKSIDVVIMGSHGVGGLGKMLFGSTTYDVARRLQCAVLICKRKLAA
jgi:nucleotide-binding universal stress UspA family protein